jgi:hypothetical protein
MKRKAIDWPGLGTVHDYHDYLAVAINNIGSIDAAARIAGVSRMSIYKWLDDGLADAPLRSVIALAKKGDVPIYDLMRRIGPFQPGHKASRKRAA